MNRILTALALLIFAALPAAAQGGYGNTTGYVISTCASPPLAFVPSTSTQAFPGPFTIDTSGRLCVNASVTASIAGFPGSAQSTGTPIAVTTGGVTGTLPAGAEVVASNVGGTNTAYCKLGASATTSDQPIPPNSWFGFTVGTATQLTCITSASTTTVNMVGGSGLPTGAGGGGGGGGGGAITIASGAVASGAYSAGSLAAGAGVDGWNLTEGAKGDVAWTSGSGSIVAILKAIATSGASTATNTGAAIPSQATSIPIGGVTNDPCQYQTKVPFTLASSSGTTQIVAPSGSTQVYICSFSLIAGATAVVNVVGGTGASCTTGTPVAMFGSTTAASGASLAANGGLTFGNGGASVMRTTTAGHGVCVIQSGTTALAGGGTYVQQ